MDYQKCLKEFNKVFGFDTQKVSDSSIEFRASLLRSECEEFINDPKKFAYQKHKIVAQFDAILDILYVMLGTAELHNIEVDLNKIVRGLLPINSTTMRYVERENAIAKVLIQVLEYEAFGLLGEYDECKKRIHSIALETILLACECGFLHKIEQGFKEVHRSNMTKVCEDGTILRREDGKILKPKTFEEPQLEVIL